METQENIQVNSISTKKIFFIALLILFVVLGYGQFKEIKQTRLAVSLVEAQAQAWKTGDLELMESILHDDVVFAYPGRRLNKGETLEDLVYFREHFSDVEVYIHKIIVDGDDVAVEWQFAATDDEKQYRQVVSDAIIGKIKDGRIIVWKEYLDGRVKNLQAVGELELEEGEEPFPWPLRVPVIE